MKDSAKFSGLQRTVFLSVVVLFSAWLVFNARFFIATQNGLIRFVLSSFLSLLVLLRRKGEQAPSSPASTVPLVLTGMSAALCAVVGIIIPIHQLEWLGILFLMYACLAWSLPSRFRRDIQLSLLLLYWAHPLPNQVFAPLQFSMQRWSVNGSQWLLHMLNVRVWADGMVLRTPFTIYGVPEWCSGMRTATTLFLLALGLGVLRRLRWLECLVVLLAAGVQALILNILRISVMVMFTPSGGRDTNVGFLHDSAGIIVIAGVALVYFEIMGWQRLQGRRVARVEDLNPERMKAFSQYPPFWRFLTSHRWGLLAAAVSILLGTGMAFRSRTFHRADMIRSVAEGLRDSGQYETAARAMAAVQQLLPEDQAWLLTRIRLKLIRGKYQEVIQDLHNMSNPDPGLETSRSVLEAYAYLGLNQLEKAGAIVGRLPETMRRQDPRVTMILAEMAYLKRQPDEVAGNVVVASRWKPNLSRIRDLYPYLSSHGKWFAIVRSNLHEPYQKPEHALSVAEAHMNLNQTPEMATITLDALVRWPNDPRLLRPLFFLAMKRDNGEWQNRFGDHLKKILPEMNDPDRLYRLFSDCFRLARPDLSWAIFRRIEELDPTHPSLFFCLVKYGGDWFVFRKQHIGVSAPSSEETVNLAPFLFSSSQMSPSLLSRLAAVPYGLELVRGFSPEQQKPFIEKGLAECRKRDQSDTLSLPMRHEYVKLLDQTGQRAEMDQQLARLRKAQPEGKEDVRILESEILERHNDWQMVYETLRTYPAVTTQMQLAPMLRLCQAQIHLRLGLAALYTASQLQRRFPSSPRALGMLATTLSTYGSPERALHALSRPRAWRPRALILLEARLLFDTQRFVDGTAFCRSALIPTPSMGENVRQDLSLPPAELEVLWHRFSVPTEKEFSDNAATLRRNLATVKSPFFKDMMTLWLECYASRGRGISSDPTTWLACGRDRIEKAVALNQLTMLLCRHGDFAQALGAARQAVELLPESPVLWTLYISLSGADRDVIERAHKACPANEDIWLALLVARTRKPGLEKANNLVWKERDVAIYLRNLDLNRYSPAALTRAGDYLFRGNMKHAAARIARHAVDRARGLLPTLVLGIRCAISELDKPWALACTKKSIEASLSPLPDFYRKLVQLKVSGSSIAADEFMVAALKRLRQHEPENPLWAQMLGYVRFQRKGWEFVDAVYQMTAAIDGGATNATPFMVGAEASRLLGNNDRAVDLLHRGLKQHPDNLNILNNLIFVLAQTPDGLKEATERLPLLIEQGRDNPDFLDTAIVVLIQSERFTEANRILAPLLAKAPFGGTRWFRAKLHQATILMRYNTPTDVARQNAAKQAEPLLQEILTHSKGIPDEDIIAANRLLSEIESLLRERAGPDTAEKGE